MKRICYLILLLLFACEESSSNIDIENSSPTFSTLPFDVCAASSVVWNTNLYLFGGSDDYNGTTNYSTIYKYDGSHWSLYDSIPDNSTWDGRSVIVGDEVFYVNGWSSDSVLLRKFNMNTKQWTSLAKGGLTDDWGTAAVHINGSIYHFDPRGRAEKYQINNNTWTRVYDEVIDVAGYDGIAAVAYNTDVYITGYSDSSFVKYSTLNNQYTFLENLPVLMSSPLLFERGGVIYVLGGGSDQNPSITYTNIYKYSISNSQWNVSSSSLSKGRIYMAGSILADEFITIGGIDTAANLASNLVEHIPIK